MASKSKIIAELFEADGDIIASALDNVVVTPTAVSDQPNTSTGGFTIPSGTTAQRPSSPDTGETRMNSTTGSLEFYDSSAWISTNLIPNISNITGDINNAYATDLVFTVTNHTDSVDVLFSEGGVVFHTVSGESVSSGTFTLATPSQVYGQTAGDTISISVQNADGTPSGNAITKTVLAAPTGGTITTTSGYRYHKFTSSSTFTTAYSVNADIVVVAGGGGGGCWVPGGGGAGGLIDAQYSSAGIALNGTHTVTIGAGGTGTINPGNYSWQNGTRGIDSYIEKSGTKILTAAGGGRGGSYDSEGDGLRLATSGGSGGGRGKDNQSDGAGIQTTATSTPGESNTMNANSRTYGYGSAGGSTSSNEGYGQEGGGGASGTQEATGNGQDGRTIAWLDADSQTFGTNSSNSATSGNYFAGGGGAGNHSGGTVGVGGAGGGATGLSASTSQAPSGLANTGGAGGGGGNGGSARSEGGDGGSGIIIIRYAI